jgi:HD-GYP domain-containing protein (c-di-GMP phosphodiesterase class II)
MRERSLPMLAAAAFAACVPPALLHFFGSEKVYIGGWIHFGGVAVGAGLATAAALALTIVGARRRDARAVLVGCAFSVMATLLCLHGLTTPGIFVEQNGVVAFTGGATLPVGAAILALSALPSLRRPEAVRPLLWLLGASIALVIGLGVTALLDPALVPSVPESGSAAAYVLLVGGLGFYGLLFLRALRTHSLTQRPSDLLVAVGLAWLAAALVAALTLGYWNLGWWLGHAFELVGIAFVALPVALDLRRGDSMSRALVGDLRGADLVASEEAYLGSQVRALLVALAAKDGYTEEHTRRVALRAVQVGEELGLPPARLRTLAVGGLVHDVGKLSVPDEILKKPGPLTDAEFAVVQRHARWGVGVLGSVGGFGEGVLRLVRQHHERLDGSGYPDGLSAAELSIDVRILGVCDVYDALVSARVYRAAWSEERAIGLLRASSGTEFDPACVEALVRVLGRERGEALDLAV